MGRSGGRTPARASLMARTSASTAASWPKITCLSAGSRPRSRSWSETEIVRAGTPAIVATTASISGTSTTGSLRSAARQPLGRPRLVEEIDCLVGQLLVAQVPHRQVGGRTQRLGRESHTVMRSRSASSRPPGSAPSLRSTARGRRSSGSGGRARDRARARPGIPGTWSSQCSGGRPTAPALSRFDASSAPSLEAPAPTIVWISSMKRIASGSSWIAEMTPVEALLELASQPGARQQAPRSSA